MSRAGHLPIALPLVLLILIPSHLFAMPVRPDRITKGEKGPIEVKVRRIEEVRPSSTTAPPPSVALAGEHRLLVVLVETKDAPWPKGFEASRYHELIFDRSSASMREYYRENSYGRFDLTGEVIGPVQLEGSMRDYRYERTDPDGARVRRLIERAAKAAGKQTKLASFDTHDTRGKKGKDGVLDHLLVIYSESTGKHDGFAPIWPHRGSLDVELGKDLRLGSYIILNHAARLGVYVHEFGHDLGLPDLYDRDYTSHGAGDWCTMASGSWAGDSARPVHMSAWGKIRLGWIAPEVIAKPVQNLRIPSASERAFALKIPIGEIDSREYFVVENRRRVGFDELIPAEGLVVWHIDESKGDNDDERRKMVDVVEATRDQDLDRLSNLESPNYLADVFAGNGKSTFDDDTDPSARSNDGEPSKIRIKVLTPPERVMSIDLSRPEIFNPGGVPFVLSEDGYTFGRFFVVPLGKGSEGLMQLETTPGGFLAYGAEVFVAGQAGGEGRATVRLYRDQDGKPGKILVSKEAKAKISPEGYAWIRSRLTSSNEGVRFGAHERVWIGVVSDDGKTYPAMNPFSTSRRARFRSKANEPLSDTFNFRDKGKTPANDYIIRLSGFGYLEGSERAEPLANDADELVRAMKKADARADKKEFAEAMREYETVLAGMEKDTRRYETWIPVVVNSIGVMAYELKRYDVALERFEVSLRRAQAAQDEPNTADIYENLGETAFFAGKIADAKSYCERSRALNARLSRRDRLVENLYWLGRSHQEVGEASDAEARFRESLAEAKRAFAKEAALDAEWDKRIRLALAGTPEDKPKVAERAEGVNEDAAKKKQKARYTDLLQFLAEDAAEGE